MNLCTLTPTAPSLLSWFWFKGIIPVPNAWAMTRLLHCLYLWFGQQPPSQSMVIYSTAFQDFSSYYCLQAEPSLRHYIVSVTTLFPLPVPSLLHFIKLYLFTAYFIITYIDLVTHDITIIILYYMWYLVIHYILIYLYIILTFILYLYEKKNCFEVSFLNSM